MITLITVITIFAFYSHYDDYYDYRCRVGAFEGESTFDRISIITVITDFVVVLPIDVFGISKRKHTDVISAVLRSRFGQRT